MMQQEFNELRPELMATLSMDPFKANNSASRSQMVANHLGQHLTIMKGEERFIQSDAEVEYGKYTFSVKMPCDGKVLAVIHRYDYTHDIDNIAFSPQTVVIYEKADSSKEVGCIDLRQFSTQHQYFGFEYKRHAAWSKLRYDSNIREGEVFQDSPAINDHGGYEYANNLNTAFMTVSGVAEDGVILSKSGANRYAYKTYESRVVECGSKQFPLNTYGTLDKIKTFPDIGDYVRPDGLLMATRDFNEEYAPVEQSIYDIMEVDPFFDNCTYCTGGGRVVDIRIHHQRGNSQAYTPELIEQQFLKYDRGRKRFYQEILDVYRNLARKRGVDLSITPEFSELVSEAISVLGHVTGSPNDPIRLIYRQAVIDEWRLEFIIENTHYPKEGAKFTDVHGGN